MVEVMTVDDAKRRLGKQVYSYELMCLVDRVSASHSVILYVHAEAMLFMKRFPVSIEELKNGKS
jgi:Tfp pilus assembly PilM family ATPase